MVSIKERIKGIFSASKEKTSDSILEHSYLQYDRPGNKGECELVVGLDFGTSSSKVVIQAPDLPGQPSYAIRFGRLTHEETPYLLPTKLYISSDGICSLGEFEGAQMINDIKLELFSKEDNIFSNFGPTRQKMLPKEIATCYLALVLWVSRRWFLEKKVDLIRQFSEIVWSMNLGVPSPCIEDNEENLTFRQVGEAAWKLSTLGPKNITLDNARAALEDFDLYGSCLLDNEKSCDFAIVPEIAAGAIGYAMSTLRKEGLHVMIDVGSSTVDVCSFRLNKKEGSDRYELLIADVKPLGTFRLYSENILALKEKFDKHIAQLRDKHEPMDPIKLDSNELLIEEHQLISAFEEAKEKIKQELLYMLRVVIWQTKCRRDRAAPIWKNGRLPVLLIGGGNRDKFFRSALEEINDWLIFNAKNDGINLIFPPIPDSLTDSISDEEQYNLLAVAWGLSHRSLDIGDIIPADQIKDVKPPPPRDYRHKFVGKELT